MVFLAENYKIVGSVIKLITVKMMNFFGSCKLAPQVVLHDVSMLIRAGAINPYYAIALFSSATASRGSVFGDIRATILSESFKVLDTVILSPYLHCTLVNRAKPCSASLQVFSNSKRVAVFLESVVMSITIPVAVARAATFFKFTKINHFKIITEF